MTDAPSRLFVALYPDEAAQADLVALREPLKSFRWTPADQLHLTLRFIGEVPAEHADRAAEALSEVRVTRFELTLREVGFFPPHGRTNVVWAGVGTGHPHLFQLRQRVDDALLGVGLQLDLPPFHPHFTLARVAEATPGTIAEYLKRHRAFAGARFPVEAFHLVESTLGPGGAIHRVRRSFPLRTPAAA